jgi:hypothetical protein
MKGTEARYEVSDHTNDEERPMKVLLYYYILIWLVTTHHVS